MSWDREEDAQEKWRLQQSLWVPDWYVRTSLIIHWVSGKEVENGPLYLMNQTFKTVNIIH